MEKGGIPEMVKDPNEMLGKIDSFVDHRHGKFHLEPAIPFIKAGFQLLLTNRSVIALKKVKIFSIGT